MGDENSMNQNEKEIMKHLRQGKKLNISAIARELSLPISTVADKLKRIEEKYVTKRSSLLDYKSLGYTAHHIVAIKASPHQKSEVLDFLKQQKCVNSVYHTNSSFSFLIEVVCRDSFQFINWVEQLKSKFSVELQPFQILKVEERERFMPE